MGAGLSRKPVANGRIVVLSGAGEDEVNGVYIEIKPIVENQSQKPSFLYAGRTRSKAAIVIWWVDSGEQWSIGKFPRTRDVASSNKLWYIASAGTGADVGGALPPSTGWATSAKAPATYSIEPAPKCEAIEGIDNVPADALKDMFKRGVQYAAGGE